MRCSSGSPRSWPALAGLSPDPKPILEIIGEARRLVDEQRRAFRSADFAGFLATARALDGLTNRLQHVESEHLNEVSRAGLVDLHLQLEQQRQLLVMAIAASIPPLRTYARGTIPKTKSSLLLDSYS